MQAALYRLFQSTMTKILNFRGHSIVDPVSCSRIGRTARAVVPLVTPTVQLSSKLKSGNVTASGKTVFAILEENQCRVSREQF